MLKKIFVNNIIIILFTIIFLTPLQLSYADYDSFTVNIPNSQGGYTTIVIKQAGNGFIGPKGEFYSQFPSVYQLQAIYGLVEQSDEAQREKMIEQQADEQAQASQQRMIQQQQLIDQQNIHKQNFLQLTKQQARQQQALNYTNSNPTAPGRQQSEQNPTGNLLNEIMSCIFLIIIGICSYTCFYASKGRMLFFYNWYDLLGSFSTLILAFTVNGSDNPILVYMGQFIIIGYNFYMSYTYYYPKKQYMNMIFVGLSRIIMTIFLPIAYLLGLFLGPKHGDSSFEQITDAAIQMGWYYYITKFLYCLVNGHLLVELEEETVQHNQHKEESVKKTPYEILGVSPTDTIEKIKASYRNLMMKYHPDRMAGLGEEIINFATIKTQEINAAYDLILKAKGMNRG